MRVGRIQSVTRRRDTTEINVSDADRTGVFFWSTVRDEQDGADESERHVTHPRLVPRQSTDQRGQTKQLRPAKATPAPPRSTTRNRMPTIPAQDHSYPTITIEADQALPTAPPVHHAVPPPVPRAATPRPPAVPLRPAPPPIPLTASLRIQREKPALPSPFRARGSSQLIAQPAAPDPVPDFVDEAKTNYAVPDFVDEAKPTSRGHFGGPHPDTPRYNINR